MRDVQVQHPGVGIGLVGLRKDLLTLAEHLLGLAGLPLLHAGPAATGQGEHFQRLDGLLLGELQCGIQLEIRFRPASLFDPGVGFPAQQKDLERRRRSRLEEVPRLPEAVGRPCATLSQAISCSPRSAQHNACKCEGRSVRTRC